MDVPSRFMAVQDEEEGEQICERLRAGGIKCAVQALPDVNTTTAIWGGQGADALFVLVNEGDVEKARALLADR
jgi:hypothetical protein